MRMLHKTMLFMLAVFSVAAATLTAAPTPGASDTAELLKRIHELEQEKQRLEEEKQTLTRQLEENDITPATYNHADALFDKSLEQLMQVELGTASLTETTRRKTPSTVTIITREDIQHSGARSLFELLEVHVPNFQWMPTGIFPRHMGLRGIMDGRDDKYLLLVNGRVMNEKTNFGVLTERDLPMLRDLQRIEVVRGPGSALFGPGALAMVINLIVDDPSSFEGLEVTVRGGAVEKFYSGEFKWGKMFSETEGLFLYGGGTEYPGAAGEDSPLYFGLNGGVWKYGSQYYVDDAFTGPIKGYNEAYRGLPKLKLHAHYLYDDLNIWARYTQGGEYVDQSEYWPIEAGLPQRDILYGMGYRQATLTTEYKQHLSNNFSLTYRFSYARTQVETTPYSLVREMSYREDDYQGRILANWTINDAHQLAFGGEWIHEEFGLDPDGRDTTLNYRMGNKTAMPRWGTDTRSLIGEYQWTINDKLTTFISGRLDDHTYVKTIFSPRATLVYTPTQKSTWKFMASKASRTNVAQEMKLDILGGNNNSEYETLKAYELRYEHQHNKQFWWAVSGFVHDHDMVGWNWGANKTSPIGTFDSYGLELESSYATRNCKIRFSHSFTKLNKVDFADGVNASELTPNPNIYETNFANWSDHQTKLSMEHNLSEKLLLTNSMVIYWGYPGAEDYARSITTLAPKASSFFGPSYFWNMGLQYQHSPNTTFRVDAYNILGWLDEDAGKRLYGFTYAIPAMYRVQPASFGFQLIHNF